MDKLKEYFNKEFYEELILLIHAVYPGISKEKFLSTVTKDLEKLALKARLRKTAVTCREFLPNDFRKTVGILSEIAPQMKHNFVGMFIPEYIGLYGLDDFEFSMESLKYLTQYSSSEFAVREFLKQDFPSAIKIMISWSQDENYHVRRLASEGSRPRLPWSFHLRNLMEDPSPVRPILENLKEETHTYVKKSVANHLNDISKDHPDWMLDITSKWNLSNSHTFWIVKHASRSLIKDGYPGIFERFGFENHPEVEIKKFQFKKPQITLGESLDFSFTLSSKKSNDQKLAVDYKIYFRKKTGKTRPKVFKLKEVELTSENKLSLNKTHLFGDFTTRKHYAGEHAIEIMINGYAMIKRSFYLTIEG